MPLALGKLYAPCSRIVHVSIDDICAPMARKSYVQENVEWPGSFGHLDKRQKRQMESGTSKSTVELYGYGPVT